MHNLYRVNLAQSAHATGPITGRYSFFCQFSLLLLLLLPCLSVAEQPPAADTPADWCSSYQVPLTQTPDRGRAVISATLLANMRLPIPVNPVKVTLVGVEKHLPVVTSSLQCSHLVVFDALPPGEYRLQSIEGKVDLFTAPKRFLYPLPQDGYQLVFTGGNSGLYRAQVPRKLGAIIKAQAGETTFAGALSTDTLARRPWGISVAWDHALNTQTALCQAFQHTYKLSDGGSTDRCDGVAPSGITESPAEPG
jgi:hypothetical protein